MADCRTHRPSHCSSLIRKVWYFVLFCVVLFEVNDNEQRDPQLDKVQGVRDFGVLSQNMRFFNQTSSHKTWGTMQKRRQKF